MFRIPALMVVTFSTLTPVEANAQLTLVSPEKEKNLRHHLPEIDDPNFKDLLKKHIIFYTEDEMPPAYQLAEVGREVFWGIHNPKHNVSAVASEPHGNGNREFPWVNPAGLVNQTDASHFKFVHLPGKIEWWEEKTHDIFEGTRICWSFPEGTVFGEVLMVGTGEKAITFEVRIRQKSKGVWVPTVYRPFPTLKDLQLAIRKALEKEPALANDPGVKKILAGEPASTREVTVEDRGHVTKQVIKEPAVEWVLPDLPEALTRDLLKSNSFKKDFGEKWDKDQPFSVTSKVSSVVPKDYFGTAFQVTRGSCIRCHEGTNESVSKFDYLRDWYGRIRGSDAIFSFHIFSKESISQDGYGKGFILRPELEKAGLLQKRAQ